MLKPVALAIALLLSPALMTQAMANSVSEEEIVTSDSFLSHHPDLRFRLAGIKSYERGNFEKALTYFKRAARYADKPSQAMVGEMYWRGEGVTQDRVQAYIWMDLAAERQYKLLAIQREKYWDQLDTSQREAALKLGPSVFAEYADDVAKPRLAGKLRKGKRNMAGSRTGFAGNTKIILPSPNAAGEIVVEAKDFLNEEYWDVDQYLDWQEEQWNTLPTGRVDIGPLQTDAPTLPNAANEQ